MRDGAVQVGEKENRIISKAIVADLVSGDASFERAVCFGENVVWLCKAEVADKSGGSFILSHTFHKT